MLCDFPGNDLEWARLTRLVSTLIDLGAKPRRVRNGNEEGRKEGNFFFFCQKETAKEREKKPLKLMVKGELPVALFPWLKKKSGQGF